MDFLEEEKRRIAAVRQNTGGWGMNFYFIIFIVCFEGIINIIKGRALLGIESDYNTIRLHCDHPTGQVEEPRVCDSKD